MLRFSFTSRTMLLGLALAAFLPTLHANESHCILAGRLNSEGRWAPQASGMQLLNAEGKLVSGASSSALSAIKAVRVTKPALLASCNAGQAMPYGDATKANKNPVPAVKAGNTPLEVQAMSTLPGRAGGQWVELRLNVPAERVVILTR
jgi:hypothetical protein